MNDWLADHSLAIFIAGCLAMAAIAAGGIACTFDWF